MALQWQKGGHGNVPLLVLFDFIRMLLVILSGNLERLIIDDYVASTQISRASLSTTIARLCWSRFFIRQQVSRREGKIGVRGHVLSFQGLEQRHGDTAQDDTSLTRTTKSGRAAGRAGIRRPPRRHKGAIWRRREQLGKLLLFCRAGTAVSNHPSTHKDCNAHQCGRTTCGHPRPLIAKQVGAFAPLSAQRSCPALPLPRRAWVESGHQMRRCWLEASFSVPTHPTEWDAAIATPSCLCLLCCLWSTTCCDFDSDGWDAARRRLCWRAPFRALR